jgi:threonine/homoserine/homoserine lactone efflux protein
MLVIKLCGAAVFVAAALVGLAVLLARPTLYYAAIGIAGAALIVDLLSALPWRRRPTRYP